MDLKLTATRAFLEQGDDFLLTTHVNSDADGLAVCLALMRLLRGAGKRADIGLPDPVADQCYFLDGWDQVHHHADLDLASYRCVVIADRECAAHAEKHCLLYTSPSQRARG